jgi:hypothetical protein
MRQKRSFLAVAMLAAIFFSFADSAFAALLGVQPAYPAITFTKASNMSPPYSATFDPVSGIFSVTAAPVAYRWTTSLPPVSVMGDKSISIRIHLDGNGQPIPNTPGDGIVVTGHIEAGSTSCSGVLLTGSITAFGFAHSQSSSPTTTDSYDFRFTPTGGALISQYNVSPLHDIGVTMISENSTFTGNFTGSFQGDAKGTIGVIAGPYLDLSQTCSDASGQGEPIQFSSVITNTGSEDLSNITCSNLPAAALAGAPASLAAGASATFTGSYLPSSTPSTGVITCSATGATTLVTVSKSSSATCKVLTAAGLKLSATCSNAPAPGEPVSLFASVTNSGNETLTGITCSDSFGATLYGVPTYLIPGATASLNASYLPAGSNASDTVTCSATGSLSGALVSANSSATCGIDTNPTLALAETCSNASAPGEPINLAAVLRNSGNETLTGFKCSDSTGATVLGVPTSLAPGATAALSASYLPPGNSSTDILTCSATGAINGALASVNSSATCGVTIKTSLTVSESCSNASAPGQPIAINAVIANPGNETLTAITCSDTQGAALSGVPATLAPGATATVTGSYTPSASPATDTITCQGNGTVSGVRATANSSSTCLVEEVACILIKKQVSTTCTVTGSKDKHCKTDESKDDHCKRGDCDHGYCRDGTKNKQSYCQEVTQKQAHCGKSESKASYCSKSGCDRGYCDSQDSKDDYCKVPAAPVCVPVWLDANSLDTGATMNYSSGSRSASGDDLLALLSFAAQGSGLINKLIHAVSNDGSDEAAIYGQDANQSDDRADDQYKGADYYQGHLRQSNLMYRFLVTNCGAADLTGVVIDDQQLGIADYPVGTLKAGDTVTLTSEQIPQLSQARFTCSESFVNSATVSGTDASARIVMASDDAWVVCNTKSCTFTQGYWINHPSSWPVTTLKLGTTNYTQSQLLSMLGTPVTGDGLVSLAHQLIAAKLNAANGTSVPNAVSQAMVSADTLIGAQIVPPIGSGSLAPSATGALTATLDSYNSGAFPGGPSHCGEPAPTRCTGVIGDFVWSDLNRNGVQASGEPGIPGVKVTLSNGKSTSTDATGHYSFTGLCQGSYQVKVNPPCGLAATTASSLNVTLGTDSTSILTADFGLAKPALSCSGKIGDFVWNDANMNGIQDSGEQGLSGLTVTLSNGTQVVTDSYGRYQFGGLCAGDYTVAVASPAGYTPSAVGQGNNSSIDSKSSPAKVTLTSNGSSVQNIDFGFYKTVAPACTGVIGNFVWNDKNKNGVQDCGEPGIAGVTVKLSNGLSAITDADGHYQFAGLCAGTYTVSADTPALFAPSPTLQGTNRAADSNASPASVTLGDNRASDLSIDFGFYQLPKPICGTGCSLGYWKNHTANWPGQSHGTDNFDAVFGSNVFTPDKTLLQALNLSGGGLFNLARQATAALLNAEDRRLDGYPLTTSQVKQAVLNALLSGNYDALATQLESYNNLGCPLN